MKIRSAQTYDDAVFVNHFYDRVSIAAKTGLTKYLFFLDERQQLLLERLSPENYGCSLALYGGYEGAVRKMAAVYPSDAKTRPEYPVSAASYYFKPEAALTHRDFLGSIMSRNIKRELVGDILVESDRCVVFCHQNALSVLLHEIDKIGRWGVRCEQGFSGELPAPFKLQSRVINVSSLRADCVVSTLAGVGREKALQLISQDLVSVNYQNIEKPAYLLHFGDILTIRGHGKFILDSQLAVTKKGRLSLSVNQYV